MRKLKVLIGCEESQEVCKAFRRLGHEAFSCDIQECSGGHPEWHIKGDIFQLIRNGFFNTQDGDLREVWKWDMGIFFPPCTDLAVSGAPHFEIKKTDGRQKKSVDFFMKFTNLPIKYTAIENPVGIMSSIFRKPDQIINPFYFGNPVPKKTCLWLNGLPKLYHNKSVNLFDEIITHVTPEYLEYNSLKTKTGKSKYSVFGKLGKGHGKERSVTFPGIANAMATQWSEYILNKQTA